jgi:PAS domain S-box-containing protein
LSDAPSLLRHDGEAARLIAGFDWSATSLGPIASWTPALKTAVGVLIRSAVPIVMLWGEPGYMIYNDAYSVFAGARHPALLGMKVREAWPEVADFNDNVMKVGLAGGTLAYRDQELTLYRNGAPEQVWLNLDYSPVLDESGTPAGVIAIVVETTERVLADRRRAFRVELADRLATLTNRNDLPHVAARMLGGYLGVSRVGFSEIAADGETAICETCYVDGVAPFAGEFRLSALGTGNAVWQRLGKTLVVGDVATDPAQDQVQWAALETRAVVSVPLIRDGLFRASMFINQRTPRAWTAEEITTIEEVASRTWDAMERVRAEELLRKANETLEAQVAERTRELAASRARMRTIFENSLTLQGLVGLDGIVIDVNRTSLQVIAAELSDVVGKPFAECPWFSATPGMADIVRNALSQARAGHAVRQEVLVNLPVGGWRWFDFALRPILDAAGQVVAIVPEAAETTERRQTEEALRQAQKLEAMGQLTGGVAHDFNNLLTPILGCLDMLHRRRVGNEREQLLVEGGLQSAERARTLVQRLLAFARKQPLQPQPVDVAAVMGGMRELIASTIGASVHLQVDVPPSLPAAIAEITQLEMALLNLAVNARDAMPDGGTLRMVAAAEQVTPPHPIGLRAGHYVRISMSDTGTGMDEATLQRAVEPFFSTKGIGKGTGLGLSMVHGLALQLGGGLAIASTLNVGTTVDLYLPATLAPADLTESSVPARAVTSAGTALLVDDEDAVRATTAAMLADLGYNVLQAASAAEALTLLQAADVDILVTDHVMPGMSGTALAYAVRTHLPRLPVLVISGYAELDGVAPDLPRLAKPFRSADLAATLAAIETRSA